MKVDKLLRDSQKIRNIILQEMENPELNGQVIGQKLGISRMHLHRKIKVATGKSIGEYILQLRIEKAQEMLLRTEEQITSIAYGLGFKDASYFTRVFKKKMNCTPSQFRVMWSSKIQITSPTEPVVEEYQEEVLVRGERQRG